MTHEVQISPIAIDDLIALYRWIAQEADAGTASAYIERIEARCASLAESSLRGAAREDLAPGLRTLSFERRVVIAYKVEESLVRILRVVSGAREMPGLLS